MKFINFPESNMVLGAGKGNENTSAIRVIKLSHPGYKAGTEFMAAKFDYTNEEKQYLKQVIDEAMSKNNTLLTSEQIDVIINSLPPLWINCMHGWFPLILSVCPPLQMGYEKVSTLSPKDN